MAGADQRRHVRLHQFLDDEPDRLAQDVAVLACHHLADDLLDRHAVLLGHGRRGGWRRRARIAAPADALHVAVDPGKAHQRVWLANQSEGLLEEPRTVAALRDGVEVTLDSACES